MELDFLSRAADKVCSPIENFVERHFRAIVITGGVLGSFALAASCDPAVLRQVGQMQMLEEPSAGTTYQAVKQRTIIEKEVQLPPSLRDLNHR